MKKWLIGIWFLTVSHTLWLAAADQNLEKSAPLFTIREEESGDEEGADYFMKSPTSPPPVDYSKGKVIDFYREREKFFLLYKKK